MGSIVAAPKDTMRTPTTVVDMGKIVALLLLLAGLEGCSSSARDLDSITSIDVNFIVSSVQSHLRLGHRIYQNISVLKRIPTFRDLIGNPS